MAGRPLHDRLYRALLKLFPREFRGDFGDQMAEDFNDQRADAAASGRAAGVRLWARTSVDVLRRAPRRAPRHPAPRRRLRAAPVPAPAGV
jgi:hypothetical protein